MKFISKLSSKIGVLLVALAMVLSFGIMSPSLAIGVSADSVSHLGGNLSLSNVKTIYKSTDVVSGTIDTSTYTGVILPTATYSAGTLTITAKNAAGKSYTDKIAQGVSVENVGTVTLFCTEERLGNYTITYTVTYNNVKTTKDITITFEGDTPSFSFATNAKADEIVPSKVNAGTKLRFVYPNIILNSNENTIIPASDTHGNNGTTTITLLDSNSTEVALTDNNGVMEYTIPTTNTVYGNYTAKYSYTSVSGYTISTTKIVEVVKTEVFDQTKDVELKISGYSSSWDNVTLEVGIEETLPTPTVVNSKNNSSIDTHTDITVEYLNNSNWTTLDTTITNYKFTPDKAGEYRFTYKVKDFYGDETSQTCTIKTATYTSSSLKIKAVKGYSIDNVTTMASDFDELEDASYMIPSKIATGTTKTLPAIFGVGAGLYSDLTFTRSLSYNGTIDTSKINTAANETCDVTFDKAGTYSITYTVAYKDHSTVKKSLTTFKVIVEDDFEHTAFPEVAIQNVTSSIEAGESFTVDLVANDYKTDAENNKTVIDADMETHVYYYYNDQTIDNKVEADLNSDGKYVIPTVVGKTSVTVYAEAINDMGKTGSDSVTVEITNNASDIVAPTLDLNTSETFDDTWYNQQRGTTINLPGVTVSDANTNVQVKLVAVHNDTTTVIGTRVNGTNSLSFADNTYSFVLSNIGEYTFNYIASDANGNVAMQSFTVNSVSDAVPSVRLNLNTTAEYGDTIDVYGGLSTYLDNELVRYAPQIISMSMADLTDTSNDSFIKTILDSATTNKVVIGVVGNPVTVYNNKSIKVDSDITIKAWAVRYDNSNKYYDLDGSNTVNITVSDTTAPVFSVVGGTATRQQALYTDSTKPDGKTLAEANTVYIPWFDALSMNDSATGFAGSGIETSSLKIVVKYESDSSNLATFTSEDTDDATRKVVATKDGKIIATYTLSDVAGNEATQTITFNIGDVTAPTISLGDLTFDSKTIGDKLTIDLTKIVVAEDKSTMTYKDVTVKVTRDGETVTINRNSDDESITLDLDTAGEYSIAFSCEDKAGNDAETITKTFTVSAKSSTPVNSTTVWGTILIVLALIILGVVIYFFVKPSKVKVNLNTDKKTK